MGGIPHFFDDAHGLEEKGGLFSLQASPFASDRQILVIPNSE